MFCCVAGPVVRRHWKRNRVERSGAADAPADLLGCPFSVITAPRSSQLLLERLLLAPREDRDRQRLGRPSIV
jgi:hypothetical protein